MIRGVQDVYVNVSNMERAVSFYRDVLMLRLVEESPYWCAFDVNGLRLGLHFNGGKDVPEVPADDHGPHAGAVLTLRVGDLFTAVDHFREMGVRFLGEIADGAWGSTICFRDPDGNVLKLMQPR